jgi:hypothetical protein
MEGAQQVKGRCPACEWTAPKVTIRKKSFPARVLKLLVIVMKKLLRNIFPLKFVELILKSN